MWPATENGSVPYSGYPVEIQTAHFLHCVNLLRQGLWFNVDYYRATHPSWDGDNIGILEKHVLHCVDALRQFIMCDVDLQVIPWFEAEVDGRKKGKPDFTRPKQCKNFESYLKWHRAWRFDNPNTRGLLDLGRAEAYHLWSGQEVT